MVRASEADRVEPHCRLVKFEAADGVELAGLLYEPRRVSPETSAVIWLHGTGGASVFDSRRTNLIAAELVARGIAFFPFNNRGAHLVRRLKQTKDGESQSIDGGMAHEVIREVVPDVDGAIRELRARGYRQFHLAGHSTGANKIAVYDHYKPRNPIKRYLLIAGGDDTGMLYDQLGPRRFSAMLEKARAMIDAQRGHEIAPTLLTGGMMMSWRALLDMADPNGDYDVFPFLAATTGRVAWPSRGALSTKKSALPLRSGAFRDTRLSPDQPFRFLRAIRKPALLVYGESDPFCFMPAAEAVALLAEALAPAKNFAFALIEDADHGFGGRERELGKLIAAWVAPR